MSLRDRLEKARSGAKQETSEQGKPLNVSSPGLTIAKPQIAARDPKAVDVSSLNKLISSTGLTVPAIGTGRVFGEDGLSFCDAEQEIRRKAIQRIKGHIELAAELQSQVIIGLVRGICRGPMTHDDAVKWVTEGLEECAAYASSCGVKLTLEAINRYETNLLNTVSECLQKYRYLRQLFSGSSVLRSAAFAG
jgi:sugar phosphate isomerase/epimerase